MESKRLLLLFLTVLATASTYAQRGYDGSHLYDFGLPDGKEVGDSLLKAIPLLIIGFIILYTTSKMESTYLGCLGTILMIIGGIFLLPLLAWVEYIFQSALSIGIVIAVVVGGIYAIVNWLKK